MGKELSINVLPITLQTELVFKEVKKQFHYVINQTGDKTFWKPFKLITEYMYNPLCFLPFINMDVMTVLFYMHICNIYAEITGRKS